MYKRLSNLFHVKNITPFVLKSNVAHKYFFAGCSTLQRKLPTISTLEFANT